MNSFTDSLVDLCRIRGAGETYPSLNTTIPNYPYFSYSTSTNPTYIQGKSHRRSVNPASRQDLGDTSHMLTLASIFRSIPPTRPSAGFKYVVISDRGSDWIRLIQFIDTKSIGYVSADRRGVDFDYDKLAVKPEYLRPFYGKDGMGNLDDNFSDFVRMIDTAEGKRIDEVLCDCSRTNPITTVKIATKVLREGGSLILRINGVDEGLIYVISHLFKRVTLFRPLLQEVYVVASDFSPSEEALVLPMLIVPLDKTFLEWIEEATNGVNERVDAVIDELVTRRVLNV